MPRHLFLTTLRKLLSKESAQYINIYGETLRTYYIHIFVKQTYDYT